LRHQDRRSQHASNIGVTVDDAEEILRLWRRTCADDERQAEIAILDKRLKHGSIGSDDADATVLLPKRKG
jgi:hypothetical protein